LRVNTANTGTASVNVNGLGAKTVRHANGNALGDGDMLPAAIIF
jgi:hypothetical protein